MAGFLDPVTCKWVLAAKQEQGILAQQELMLSVFKYPLHVCDAAQH